MPSTPNDNHQRAERDRAKTVANDAMLRGRKNQAAVRQAGGAVAAEPADIPLEGAGT